MSDTSLRMAFGLKKSWRAIVEVLTLLAMRSKISRSVSSGKVAIAPLGRWMAKNSISCWAMLGPNTDDVDVLLVGDENSGAAAVARMIVHRSAGMRFPELVQLPVPSITGNAGR